MRLGSQPTGEHVLLQRVVRPGPVRVGLHVREQEAVVRRRCGQVWRPQLDAQPCVAVDDVVGAAPLDEVRARSAQDDVALSPDSRGCRGRRCRRCGEVGQQVGEPGDAGEAVGGYEVVAGEPAATDCRRHHVVTTEGVVECATGQCLDLVELVPDPGEDHAAGDEHLGEVRVLGLGVAETDLPVVAGRAGHLLDAGTGDTDVVATLEVVVVVPTLTDQDVVAGDVVVVEEERRAVTDQEVGLVSALFPVVATVAEDGVDALAADGEVVAGAHEVLVAVGAAVGEVVPVTGHDDVETGAGVDGVVAGTALGHVVAGEVGDDVVAVTTQCDVGAVTTLDDVVAFTTPEGVVVGAAPDPVDDVAGAVVDGLGVDAGRHGGVRHAVAQRAVGHPEQLLVLVTLRRRVVLHGARPVMAQTQTWPGT